MIWRNHALCPPFRLRHCFPCDSSRHNDKLTLPTTPLSLPLSGLATYSLHITWFSRHIRPSFRTDVYISFVSGFLRYVPCGPSCVMLCSYAPIPSVSCLLLPSCIASQISLVCLTLASPLPLHFGVDTPTLHKTSSFHCTRHLV